MYPWRVNSDRYSQSMAEGEKRPMEGERIERYEWEMGKGRRRWYTAKPVLLFHSFSAPVRTPLRVRTWRTRAQMGWWGTSSGWGKGLRVVLGVVGRYAGKQVFWVISSRTLPSEAVVHWLAGPPEAQTACAGPLIQLRSGPGCHPEYFGRSFSLLPGKHPPRFHLCQRQGQVRSLNKGLLQTL